MNILKEWARALRSGTYRDCRDYVPEEKHVLLKQTAWSVNDGSYVPVFNVLGVLADVSGAKWCAIVGGDFVCESDVSSMVDFYTAKMTDRDREVAALAVESFNRPSGHYLYCSFESIANTIDEYVPLGELLAVPHA